MTETKEIVEKSFLDLTKMPKHIAIIMDGNRRWAKKNNLPSIVGHTKGADSLTNIVEIALELKIKAISVFAFSTENWTRSQDEINNIMNLFDLYLKKQKDFMIREGVRLTVIGDLSKCPKNVINSFNEVKKQTSISDKLDLVIAVNYGSRDEIKRAVVKIFDDFESKKIKKEDISEELINNYLDTNNLSDPDLLIRTSGEKRLSNFLLWQLSYSEIYVTDVLWPDFSKKDFIDAIYEFQKRKRRLGGE